MTALLSAYVIPWVVVPPPPPCVAKIAYEHLWSSSGRVVGSGRIVTASEQHFVANDRVSLW
jgi:hypothetical protein